MGQQDRLKDWVNRCDLTVLSTPSEKKNSPNNDKNSPSPEENAALVDSVRETVLDLEERISSAGLGSLQVRVNVVFLIL